MITQLNLSNFKSHKDTRLELGNLTVLTGVNGCGKTSVIQALLLLRQTSMVIWTGRKRTGTRGLIYIESDWLFVN